MIEDNKYDEGNHIGKNDEDRWTDDIEVLKLGTLSSKTDIYKIVKWSDERNRINIIDDKESDERDHIGENDEIYWLMI